LLLQQLGLPLQQFGLTLELLDLLGLRHRLRRRGRRNQKADARKRATRQQIAFEVHEHPPCGLVPRRLTTSSATKIWVSEPLMTRGAMTALFQRVWPGSISTAAQDRLAAGMLAEARRSAGARPRVMWCD